MGKVKVLARDIKVYVKLVDEWIKINELESVTFSSGKSDEDTTTFDNQGWESHIVASRTRGCNLEGKYYVNPSTGERDLGQATVDGIGESVGLDSLGDFKIVFPGNTSKQFKASVNLADVGGGNNDALSWGAELTVSGQVTEDVEEAGEGEGEGESE